MSDEPKKPPVTSLLGFSQRPCQSYIIRRTSKRKFIIKKKESFEDNPLDLETDHSIIIDTLGTIKGMRIRYPTRLVKPSVDEHYKKHEEHDKAGEIDWRDMI